MGKTIAALETFIIHKRPRQLIWITVKRWTFRSGTCLRYIKSGWCFAGIQKSFILSKNWKIKKTKWLFTDNNKSRVSKGLMWSNIRYIWITLKLTSEHLDQRIVMCTLKYYSSGFIIAHIFLTMDTACNLETIKTSKANGKCCYLREYSLEKQMITLSSFTLSRHNLFLYLPLNTRASWTPALYLLLSWNSSASSATAMASTFTQLLKNSRT